MYHKDPNLDIAGSIVHSHLCLTSDQTQSYTRIFNLRQDPVQTVLSFILASKFNQYHKFSNEDLKIPLSYEFTDWNSIDTLCKNYIKWNHFYSQSLNSTDAVIIYELMIQRLKTTVYDQIYPDKQNILLNYHDIIEYINSRYGAELVASQESFLTHQGIDCYNYINYSVPVD